MVTQSIRQLQCLNENNGIIGCLSKKTAFFVTISNTKCSIWNMFDGLKLKILPGVENEIVCVKSQKFTISLRRRRVIKLVSEFCVLNVYCGLFDLIQRLEQSVLSAFHFEQCFGKISRFACFHTADNIFFFRAGKLLPRFGKLAVLPYVVDYFVWSH